MTYKETREYQTLPERIDALEREQHALRQQIGSADFYRSAPDQIRAVMARVDAIHAELEDALSRWIALEEIGP
jgi:ATP-binding cassette subfamily F protein uup